MTINGLGGKQNEISGKILLRFFLTFTVDAERSKIFGGTMRTLDKEHVMSADELKKRIADKKDSIHQHGFCILYAFHGRVEGQPVSFDTQRRAMLNTLGYARASVVDGDKIYVHFSINDDIMNPRMSYAYGEADFYPDLLGAVRASTLDDGMQIKTRTFKADDVRYFGQQHMLRVISEPGFFSRNGHVIMPEEIRNKGTGKQAKRGAGRPRKNIDEEQKLPLPDKEVMLQVKNWSDRQASRLNGFSITSSTDRTVILEKTDEEGTATIKVSANRSKVELLYIVLDENNKKAWESYQAWGAAPEMDAQVMTKEIMKSFSELCTAF